MKLLRDYLKILAPLVVAFLVYHVFAVPFLEPSEVQQATRWEMPTLQERTAWWDEFFREGHWQRKNPKFLQTQQGILLFEKREEISATRWRIYPLTILLPQRDSATGKRAIFIDNPSGAEIQFKSVPDWTTGQPPPVVSGQLIGDIQIWAPPEDPSKDNGLVINTRDVRIDKRQIWTDQAVQMQLGNSRVSGRNLSIYMDQDLLVTEPTNQVNSPFNGLDYMELIYVDQVYVGLNNGGLWPSSDVPDANSREAHATLTCGGSFEFQFHQSQARFKNGVHMEHLVQGLEKDTFDCHELMLQVGWEGKRTFVTSLNPAEPAGSTTSATASNWNIERLEATAVQGRNPRDQSKWLKLNAPGMHAAAHGQHLVMDFVAGKVKLSNRIPGTAARETTPVYLRRDAMQLWSPEVEYQSPDALFNTAHTSKTGPKRIGAILADGNGSAQLENKNESWHLSWGKRLLVRPDGDNDLIMIDGRADASSPTQGRFIAEHLMVWMTPTTDEIASKLRPYYADGNVPQSLPRYMQANGDVDIKSPKVRVQVEQMEVWFSYPTLDAADANLPTMETLTNASTTRAIAQPASAPTREPITSVQLQPAAPRLSPPVTRVSSQPASSKAAPSTLMPNQAWTMTPTIPLVVTSRSLIAKVMSIGEQTRIDDLQLEGHFTLTKDQVSENSPWPFTAMGETLRIEQTAPDLSNITMTGQPAKVQVGHGWVTAPELHLFQSEQQFWIDHPGELLLPVEALERSPKERGPTTGVPSLIRSPMLSNGKSESKDASNGIRWEEAPRLSWSKRMTFDGKTARFGGNITINCRMQTDVDTMWHIKANASRLSLEMDRPVPLRTQQNLLGASTGPKIESEPAQISLIRLEDNVEITAVQTDLQGSRRSIEVLKIPRLDVMVPTQEWIGQGPGELLSRRLGNANPMNNERANEQLAQNTKQCIHLSFLGHMQGWINKRLVTFHDRVDAIMGPIADWGDALNVHEITRLGPHQSHLICDQLSIFDASQLSWNQMARENQAAARNAAWELDALGRVRMDSLTDTDEVTMEGNRMSYNALNDIARIEGRPREPAHIYKLPMSAPLGTEPDRLDVIYASIGLKSGAIDAQISKLDARVPDNMQGPLAPNAATPRPTNPPTNAIPSPRDYNPFQPPPPKR